MIIISQFNYFTSLITADVSENVLPFDLCHRKIIKTKAGTSFTVFDCLYLIKNVFEDLNQPYDVYLM